MIDTSVDAARDARDDRVGQGAGDLDPDRAEHDAPDPAFRLHDAAWVDGDDLVHEGDEERQRADRADQALREQDPVVDQSLELRHRATSDPRMTVAPPAGRSATGAPRSVPTLICVCQAVARWRAASLSLLLLRPPGLSAGGSPHRLPRPPSIGPTGIAWLHRLVPARG